ncbi:exopolysaccharide biosynthesis protein [Ruficoccus amylovorans]|uniref:Exopolysaccharide biosynthesis protein n=1 Tax=Ruficoccus amylovorans TaxID=1804625 RepID=A0A842HF62_9BACT|nr:exopolysaccharide biosynthesis protein [Ruficoccus amylovorans]MBC2595062.1 exopolysaccharide biosynthesis protein [Ruficoccus amylovorans]
MTSADHQEHSSLSANLQSIVSGQSEKVSLGEIVDAIKDKQFGMLLVLLSIPSALPLPAAGYSTPFGIAILILGLQMLRGRRTPWLPQKMRDKSFTRAKLAGMVGKASVFFRWVEKLVRPRLRWINSSGGYRLMAVLVIFMSLLMCLPIPSTNTAPAMVIFLIGVGLCEDDGLFAIGACALGLVAALIYAVVIYFVILLVREHGWEARDQIVSFIKQQLGLE